MSKIKSANWELLTESEGVMSDEILEHYQKLANYYAQIKTKGDEKNGETD